MNPTTTEDEIREWLRSVPDGLLLQEAGRRRRARLVNPSGGRPKVLRPCPRCKEKMGARELLRHKCTVVAEPKQIGARRPRKSLTTALQASPGV